MRPHRRDALEALGGDRLREYANRPPAPYAILKDRLKYRAAGNPAEIIPFRREPRTSTRYSGSIRAQSWYSVKSVIGTMALYKPNEISCGAIWTRSTPGNPPKKTASPIFGGGG